ncbi:hypothetical protein [Pandoravirus japonicus]|uniref:Transmembrane protein n=1 Tax=Pandoravirus japonicus TaxID=2823154 RepID=A0A811BST9_9VIRU|nr:hypothetical protein [Pandoravirus japonicus]
MGQRLGRRRRLWRVHVFPLDSSLSILLFLFSFFFPIRSLPAVCLCASGGWTGVVGGGSLSLWDALWFPFRSCRSADGGARPLAPSPLRTGRQAPLPPLFPFSFFLPPLFLFSSLSS